MPKQSAVDTRRVKTLKEGAHTDGPVLYVMGRDQRVHDNWPLLYAAEKAKAAKAELLVLFAIGPMFLHGSARHNHWLIASLQDVATGLAEKNIPFFVETGEWSKVVQAFVAKHEVGLVVFDQNPLQPVRSWREKAAKQLSVPVHEVDGRNIVPVWEASNKEEFAAHTLRPKIHKKLKEFLTPFPTVPKQTGSASKAPKLHWKALADYRKVADDLVPDWLTPGELAAKEQLKNFIERIDGYAQRRNDPNEDALSHLSPYLRWGNISAQRVALTINELKDIKRDDKEAFLEELIVRRELSDNFVFYNQNYNQVAGAHEWAQKTIKAHAKDKREFTYTLKEFEMAATHDELWNAAQRQMVLTGKMHGYLRMYWAKKILEWTPDTQTAIDIALMLNDRYELDGRDSNGAVGVMWSICGVHDRAWTERPVFGKIRYMNYNGAKRKFDVDAYVARYSGSETLFDD